MQAIFEAPVIRSAEEFQLFRAVNERRLTEVYQYQRSLGSDADQITLDGLCPICSVTTQFRCPTQGGDPCPRGLEPNWRETTLCGCSIQLNARERMLLHRWLRDAGVDGPPSQLGILGEGGRIGRWLEARGHSIAQASTAPFAAPPAARTLDAILSPDHLDALADLPGQLRALHGQLRPGGLLVFTVAFFYSRDVSEIAVEADHSVLSGHRHKLGWDLLPMVEAAGFADVSAEIAWSEELGYMGSFNLVFAARRP